MKRMLLLLVLFMFGCATIPQESILIQEKLSGGIDIAKSNQEKLILTNAESEVLLKELSFKYAFPAALEKKYGQKDNYTKKELNDIITAYNSQLNSELKKVEEKKHKLLSDTDVFFRNLRLLSDTNLKLLKSKSDVNETFLDLYREVFKETNTMILNKEAP